MALISKPATYLVGDIGGTNCRLALASVDDDALHLSEPSTLKCADFAKAEDAIDHYLSTVDRPASIAGAVIAVAAPINQGQAQFTNMAWRVSERVLAQHGLGKTILINDFKALALSITRLTLRDLITIGPVAAGDPNESIAVIGAGTGFGVGALARGVGGPTAISTEGGHVSFAPGDAVEIEVLRILSRRFGHLSIERILSGPGLVNLYAALAEIRGQAKDQIGSEDIVRLAEAGDPLCRATLDRFCAIYGAAAGDIALTLGARGGVYLGGGIAPAIAGRLRQGDFRRRFEAKGRFQAYLAAIPTHIITHPYPALLGSAALAVSA
jgi:glucokinase